MFASPTDGVHSWARSPGPREIRADEASFRPVRDARWPTRALRQIRPPTGTDLRAWQTRALAALAVWERDPRRPFLISAAPGAGKTRPALEFARTQLRSGAVDRGRGGLPDGAADPAVGPGRPRAGARSGPRCRLAPTADRLSRRRRHLRADRPGAAANGPAALPRRTLVIADEAHHLGEELTWGVAFAKAFRRARGGCCCPARRFAPTPRRSRASATTPRGSPSRMSPTATPRRSPTACAGRCRSSPTTGRCRGAAATT